MSFQRDEGDAGEQQDDTGAQPDKANKPENDTQQGQSQKKKSSAKAKADETDKELATNMNKCLSYVEDMVKRKSELNHQWASILATRLDRFEDIVAEELRYEIDGIIMKAMKEKIQKESTT